MSSAGKPTARRGRIALFSFASLVAFAGIGASSASAAAPVIQNTAAGCAGQTTWLTTCASGGQGGSGANVTKITTWVQHDLTDTLPSLLTDDDWDGSTFNSTDVREASPQRPSIDGGYPRSRSNISFAHNTSDTGMSCGPFSFTRRTTDRVLRLRARDSTPEDSGTSNSTIKFVGNNGCPGAEDFPFIFNQGQNATTTTPGGNVTFTFTGDDPDSGGGENFTGVRYRKRNIATGAIVGTTTAPATPATSGTTSRRASRSTFLIAAHGSSKPSCSRTPAAPAAGTTTPAPGGISGRSTSTAAGPRVWASTARRRVSGASCGRPGSRIGPCEPRVWPTTLTMLGAAHRSSNGT